MLDFLPKKEIINSLQNLRIKGLVKLRDSKFRRQKRLFIIEGQKELRAALGLSAGSSFSGSSARAVDITEVYFCQALLTSQEASKQNKKTEIYTSACLKPGAFDIVSLLAKRGVRVIEVNEKVYSKIAFGERREGIIAIAKQPQLSLNDIKLQKNPFIVVIEAIEKPGNLGAIMRTMDACALDVLIAADPLIDLYNPNVVRASLGALFTIRAACAPSKDAISWLRNNKIRIVCAVPEAKINYTALDFKEPIAIVFGSEDKGVSKLWRDNADALASIPMKGLADSLNVSVAAAAFMFEGARQRAY